MQIQGVVGTTVTGANTARTAVPREAGLPADSYVPGAERPPGAPAHFLSDYQPVLDGPMDLPDEPAPRLQRPLLFLNGYMGVPEQFRDMTTWLERDGANKSGGILEGSNPGNVDPQANVFALRFSKKWSSIEANAAEVRAAVEAICRATGATGVDVVCHSKGGLDVRKYLMDASEKVDHVAMIGTPNKGTFLANLELVFRDRFGYPIHPPISDPEVGRTLHQLTVDRTDRQGRPYNPTLHELNAGWNTQRSRADFLTVTGSGIPTATEFPGVTLYGDGVVARKSAVLPNVPSKHLWFRTHGSLTRSKSVMTEIANFLTGKPLSPEVDLFDSPEDRQRAEAEGWLIAQPSQ